MSEKHHLKHVDEDAIAERIIKKLGSKQNQLRVALGIQHFSNRETVWDKILKYCLLPSVPIIMIGIFTMIWNISTAYSDIKVVLTKIEMRLDNIERILDNVDSRLQDHENRFRGLENGKR